MTHDLFDCGLVVDRRLILSNPIFSYYNDLSMSNKANHQNVSAQQEIQEILAKRDEVFFLEWEFVVLKV